MIEKLVLTTFLSVLLLPAQAVPVVPVSNAATPATQVNALAVKREWTLEENEFCKARAAENALNAYPRSPLAKVKYIKTFSFRGKSAISTERMYLDNFNFGFQSPFPWQEGKWLARQYVAELTPKYTYLMEMVNRPLQPGEYTTRSSVCVTVYGIR